MYCYISFCKTRSNVYFLKFEHELSKIYVIFFGQKYHWVTRQQICFQQQLQHPVKVSLIHTWYTYMLNAVYGGKLTLHVPLNTSCQRFPFQQTMTPNMQPELQRNGLGQDIVDMLVWPNQNPDLQIMDSQTDRHKKILFTATLHSV